VTHRQAKAGHRPAFGAARCAALAFAALVALAITASPAHAQGTGGEISPDLRDIVPYMMIVVDTSGSMERLPTCSCTTAACNECLPGGQPPNVVANGCTLDNAIAGNLENKKNRWAVTLEALTGRFRTSNPYQGQGAAPYAGFGCERLARTLENGMSYDLGYFLPYHQPWDCAGITSRACPFRHPMASCSTDGDCAAYEQRYCVGGRCEALLQHDDGVLDQYRAQVQFGLMTFDGWDTYVGFPPLVPVSEFNSTLSEGRSGLWSYGGAKSFHYPNCAVDYMMDTGARSANADEGRLISLNSCNDPANCPSWCPYCDPNPENIRAVLNGSIQDALLQSRPYGGTPIAGSLEDLYYHLKEDTADTFGGCRGRYALLITDGYPDDDYRNYGCDCTQNDDPALDTYCGGPATCDSDPTCPNHPDKLHCPYDTPEQIAYDLVNPARGNAAQLQKLFVVGLAVDDTAVKARLNAIALEGGNPPRDEGANGVNSAYFADNFNVLMQNLQTIIDNTIRPVSRSVPTFVGGKPGTGGAEQYQISTGFERTSSGLWAGLIERRRFTCGGPSDIDQGQTLASTTLTERAIVASEGDLFHKRLDDQGFRTLKTALPPDEETPADEKLYRGPTAPCGASGCAMYNLNDSANVSLERLGLDAGEDPLQLAIMNWMYGAPGSARHKNTPGGRRLGDIWHSSPVAVGPPLSDSGDEAFNIFRRKPAVQNRPLTLYVGSNDGILHAFSVQNWPTTNPTFAAGEEIFGFVPPLLLNHLEGNYLGFHQFMMDGTPVVKDVYFTNWNVVENRPLTPAERADMYRTVLVTGMRNGGKAYIALDVTNPLDPKFLWQYNDLTMGFTYAQPAIVQATFMWEGRREQRAVAVLPGGVGMPGPSGISGDCGNSATNPQMLDTDGTGSSRFRTFNTIPTGSNTPVHYHRQDIRCWKNVGRSLHFVDVETGKLIKRIHLESPGTWTSRRIFTSPLVGTPTVYRDGIGTLASRGFVVDADGVIWRIDMSNPTQEVCPELSGTGTCDPMNGWTVRPFHDIFWDREPDKGELTYESPIVSVDQEGRLVVIVGTGDTNNFLKPEVENRVVSLTEVIVPGTVGTPEPQDWRAAFNWEKRVKAADGLVPSELVTGAMALSERQLFFGTFIAVGQGGDACDLGKGRLFAVDYLEADPLDANGTSPPTYGPLKVPNVDPDSTGLFNVSATQAQENFFVMGLTLTTRPSCTFVNPTIQDIWGDTVPYIQERVGGSADATYLVAHASGDIGGSAPIQQHKQSKFGSIELQVRRERKLTRILSWATSVD
jgi:type IV pilus assembly protein PilY1